MNNRVTGEQVKAAMIAADIRQVDHHKCHICGYMVRYLRDGEQLLLDRGCFCIGQSVVEPRGWDDAADWINMQSRPESREELLRAFGLPPDTQSAALEVEC